MHARIVLFLTTSALLGIATGCAHQPVATVLPRPNSQFEVVAQGSTEQGAYQKAQEEAGYTCEERERRMVVLEQASVYQGADKNERDDVGAGNVALALFTGQSGKERGSDDYKVTLTIACN